MTTPTTQALEPDLPLNFCMLIDELILSWQAKGNERGQCERRIAARAALEAAIEADRNKRALSPAAQEAGALSDAVANLIKVKGRYHTEQAYQRLVEAHDAFVAAQGGKK